MKRLISSLVLTLGLIVLATVPASAQVERNGIYFNSNCAGLTPSPNFAAPAAWTAVCYDETLQKWTAWNGSAFVQSAVCSGVNAASSGSLTMTSTTAACIANVTTSSVVLAVDQTTADALKVTPTAGQIAVTGATTTDKIAWEVVKF